MLKFGQILFFGTSSHLLTFFSKCLICLFIYLFLITSRTKSEVFVCADFPKGVFYFFLCVEKQKKRKRKISISVSAETVSVSAETVSVSAETVPVSAETVSVSAETVFVSAETVSVSAETVPVSAETVSCHFFFLHEQRKGSKPMIQKQKNKTK